MKYFMAILALGIFGTLVCCNGYAQSQLENKAGGGAFFAEAVDAGKGLPADKLYPAGRVFPYVGYSPASVPDIKNRNFTSAVSYGNPESFLEAAAKEKMPVIFTVQARYKGMSVSHKFFDEQKNINWQAIADDLTQQVKEASANKAIAWWYILPEELRYWRPNEMKYLALAYNTIKAADPDKRPVWMYSPGHRNDTAMAKEARFQDIVGKGTYTNYAGLKDSRVWVRWSIEQEISAIRMLDATGVKTPILIPEMFEPKDNKRLDRTEWTMIPAWVRHDVYLGLVAGAKGVVVFSLFPSPKFPSHPIYYEAYSGVAAELTGKPNLGQVFLFGERRDDLKISMVAGQDKVSFVHPAAGVKTPIEYPSVSFANLAYGNKRYLIAVNSANAAVTAELTGFPTEGISAINAFTGKTDDAPAGGKLKLEFKPYEVIGLVFSQGGK